MFANIQEVIEANKAIGHNFFSDNTMAFFDSRIETDIIAGEYFVTSEQYHSPRGTSEPRLYTLRIIKDNGEVDTVGDFQAFESIIDACVFAGEHSASRSRA